MALLEWSDALVLGEDRMDATHREFVDCLNALGDAADDSMGAALDRFIEHTEAHFTDENERMAATNFPPSHCHLNEHEQVLKICREVRQMVADGKVHVGQVLAKELAPWFKNHAATMDTMLAYWLRLDEPGRVEALRVAAERQAAMMAEQGAAHGCGAGCSHAETSADDARPADQPAT